MAGNASDSLHTDNDLPDLPLLELVSPREEGGSEEANGGLLDKTACALRALSNCGNSGMSTCGLVGRLSVFAARDEAFMARSKGVVREVHGTECWRRLGRDTGGWEFGGLSGFIFALRGGVQKLGALASGF